MNNLNPQNILRQTQNFNDKRYLIKSVYGSEQTVNGDVVFTGLTVSDLTENSIPYIGVDGLISENNSDWFYNGSTNKIGLGMNSPGDAKMHIRHPGNQLRLEYDASKFTRIYTNSAGDCVFSSASNYLQIEGTNTYMRFAGSGTTAGTLLPNGENKHWYFFSGINGASNYIVFAGRLNSAWGSGMYIVQSNAGSRFEITDSNSASNPLFQVYQGGHIHIAKDSRLLKFGLNQRSSIGDNGSNLVFNGDLASGSRDFIFNNGSIKLDSGESLLINSTQVVGGQQPHIVDADGTLSDITTKFNTLLSQIETHGLNASS